MKKYINGYLSFIKSKSEGSGLLTAEEKEDFINELYRHILFIQHERLIHLIVLCLFSIVFFICVTALICFSVFIILPIVILLLILIIPYIAHYYFLENSTQKLYRIYDDLNENKQTAEIKNENKL